MAIASAPPVTAMPHCLGCSNCLVVVVLSESRMRRVMTLRNHSPTCMGRAAGLCGWSPLLGGAEALVEWDPLVGL